MIPVTRGGSGLVQLDIYDGSIEEWYEREFERNIIINLKVNRKGEDYSEVKNEYLGDVYNINDKSAYKREWKNSIPGLPGGGKSPSYQVITVLVEHKQKTFKMVLWNKDNDDSVENIFDNILSTFTFN